MVKIDIDSASIVQLRQELKKVRDELSSLPKDAEGFQAAAAYAGAIKDKMKDVNEQVAIFASGSKFEQAGIALGQVKDNLMNLDFEGAAEKARSLTAIIKTISFGEATKGLMDLGSTFLNLGKALLTNPLFLIPALITGILSALGLLKPIIEGVKALFESLGKALTAFTDYLGITNSKLEEEKKKQEEAAKAAAEHRKELEKQSRALADTQVEFTMQIGLLAKTNAGSKERKNLIKAINGEYGTTLKNIKDENTFQAQLNTTLETYLQNKRIEFQLKQNDEYLSSLMAKANLVRKELAKENIVLTKEQIKQINTLSNSVANGTLVSDRQVYINKILGNDTKVQYDSRQKTIEQYAHLYAEQDRVITASFKLGGATKAVADLTDAGNKSTENKTELNKDLANTLEELKNKNEEYGKSEEYLLLLRKNRTDDLIQEQYLKSTDVDKDAQRTAALLANQELYDAQYNDLRRKQASELTTLDIETGVSSLNNLINSNTAKLEANKNFYAEQRALDKEFKDAQIAAEKELYDAKWGFANGILDALAGLTGKNKKLADTMFLVQKGLAIAQIIADTSKGIVAANANLAMIPAVLPPGIPNPAFPAALATATAQKTSLRLSAATQIATLAASSISKFMGGGSVPSDSGGSNPGNSNPNLTAATPIYNLYGSSNNANTVNASNNQPFMIQNEVKVKAYVSETDITDSQKRVARYQNSATL